MEKVFDNSRCNNRFLVKKAVCITIGINSKGIKDVLSVWISVNELSKYWIGILTELRNRDHKLYIRKM